jgi:hypothetical protein
MPRVLQELDHAASTWYQHQENQMAMKATKETKKESYIWIHDPEENGSTQY